MSKLVSEWILGFHYIKSSSLFTRIIIQLKKKLSIFSLMVKTEIFEIPNNGSIPLRCFVKNKVT